MAAAGHRESNVQAPLCGRRFVRGDDLPGVFRAGLVAHDHRRAETHDLAAHAIVVHELRRRDLLAQSHDLRLEVRLLVLER